MELESASANRNTHENEKRRNKYALDGFDEVALAGVDGLELGVDVLEEAGRANVRAAEAGADAGVAVGVEAGLEAAESYFTGVEGVLALYAVEAAPETRTSRNKALPARASVSARFNEESLLASI